MNKEQQALLGEAYEGYVESYNKGNASGIQLDNGTKRVANIDEFIRRIRQDIPFAEKWGLKFEKRELSMEEELEYMMGKVFSEEALTHQVKIPTKLITITYNDKTIESYE
jgi:hypothetical protein